MTLFDQDPELFAVVGREEKRQRDTLEMIASESIQPKIARELAGSAFNNKTAVGRPGKQRLLGSAVADELESLAAKRACEVFGAAHANLTPYSGSVANYCAYAAVLKPGDRALALDPATGAHQTHGGRKNISSSLYDFRYFGLDPETLLPDYAEAERIVKEFSPKLIVIGSAAYPRKLDYERLGFIAHRNGALLMTDIAHFSGLVAAGESPNPVPFADIVSASATKTMCGPHTGYVLCTEAMREAVDDAIYPGTVSSLHLQTIAATCYALERTKTEEFRSLMRQVLRNAEAMCAELKKRGFDLFTGGTDCHLFLADLRPFGVNGVHFAERLEEIGISTNSKGIPLDPSPVANGVRAGTTVLTQRGMKEKDMADVADIWLAVAKAPDDAEVLARAKREVSGLTEAFPIPAE